ncbi:uncharacterized protein LOC126970423 [Leptidea sinapis]|uniref:uncharacterized protein LOC126970423 n=1 Tax=Leptidea sinapis TaxID=189913 RepID=UPI0021C33D80|nr:uncharacterized protein LOC126970423 [Leptidea sinapis]
MCKSNDLLVAIMHEPFRDIKAEQAQAIQSAIEGAIDAEVCAATSSTDPFRLPSFRGRANHGEGTLKLWCEDTYTVEWLKKTVSKMTSPLPHTRLVVKRQADIPRKVKATMIIPRFSKDENLSMLQTRFAGQNPWYNVRTWSLYHIPEPDESGRVRIVLGIPEADVAELKKRDRRVSYKCGSVYVNFPEEEGKGSEAPKPNPDVAAQPKIPTSTAPEAAPDNRMDVVPEGGQQPSGAAPDATHQKRTDGVSMTATCKEVRTPIETKSRSIDWWQQGAGEVDQTKELEDSLLHSDGSPDRSTSTP